MDLRGYTTGTAIGTGRANTATIANFFDIIVLSSDGTTSYYDYDWASTATFTDGTNDYTMTDVNNGVVAGKKVSEYSVNGYDDWFLPSRHELDMMCWNLKGKRDSSSPFWDGTDDNPDVPAGGVGGFVNTSYWSSSESAAYTAWFQNFSDGTQNVTPKNTPLRVRAVRAFTQ